MFYFTKQEKTVLSVFILIMISGSILQYAFKKYPGLGDIVNLIDSDIIYAKVDINTASVEELIDIPYIGAYTASNIIRYREEHGPFKRIDQIKDVKGIRDANYKKFYKYLKVSNE